MTIQQLQQASDDTRGRASREYIRERVTGRRRELERETDVEIRAAIAESFSSRRGTNEGVQGNGTINQL